MVYVGFMLGLAFTQMCPKFLKSLIVLFVRAKDEWLTFGLDELRYLCLIKTNSKAPGTLLMSPHSGYDPYVSPVVRSLRTCLIEMTSSEETSSSSRLTALHSGILTYPRS